MNCGCCSKSLEKSLVCARCKAVAYCDRDCQVTHWKVHKHECGLSISRSIYEMRDNEVEAANLRFKSVIAKYELHKQADMLADLLTGAVITPEELIEKVGQGMSLTEAKDFLRWITMGVEFKERAMDPHSQQAADAASGAF